MSREIRLPYEQRLIEEKEQLNEKIDKLQVFLEKEAPLIGMEPYDILLLQKQYTAMCEYSRILELRIDRVDYVPAQG